MTRILLVEGNDAEAREMDRSLRVGRDWEVVRAGTLLEAIRVAGEATFDAAVLDADLPDGSGLDILDFLRIGSPGIRIVLLSAEPNEQVAFHALSHGAEDCVVKDKHIDRELPRRLGALLDHDVDHFASRAMVETLGPASYEALDLGAIAAQAGEKALAAALDDAVGGKVLGAGVWDLRGRTLAFRAPEAFDGDGIGFALATIHGQIGALWTYGNVKPTGYRFVIDLEGGLLAVTAIPGTYVVGVLFDATFAPERALERAEEIARRVIAALEGSGSAPA